MKIKKYFLCTIIMLFAAFTLVACNKKPNNNNNENQNQNTQKPVEQPNEPDVPGEHQHVYVDGKCECGEKDPNFPDTPATPSGVNCALDREHEACLDPVTWSWDYNKDNWDGKGMTIEIAVDDVNEHDPFLENYKGDRKIEKQELLTKIEAEYHIDIVYRGHQNIFIGVSEEVKNNDAEIFLLNSSWIPTLQKTNSIVELYDLNTKTGIFSEYNYVQTENYNLMSTVQNKVYGYQVEILYPDHWLYYNQSLIDEYNLPDPAKLWNQGEWTWSAFKNLLADAQEAFDKDLEENKKWAMDGEYFEVVKGFVASRGGQMVKDGQVLLNDEIVVGVYEDLRELEELYWCPRGAVFGLPFEDGHTLFNTGKLDYLEGDFWRECRVDFSISVVPYPKMDDDLEAKKYKVPYSYENMYVIPTLKNKENGLSESILFNILDDINNGLIPVFRPTAWNDSEDYYEYLEERIDSGESIEAIMDIVHNHSIKHFYLEMIDNLSATLGEGSHYSENGIYPKSHIIITKNEINLEEELTKLQSIYQEVLDKIIK